jgi:hypothetical protein
MKTLKIKLKEEICELKYLFLKKKEEDASNK